MRTRKCTQLLVALVLLVVTLVAPLARSTHATITPQIDLSITPSKTTVEIGDFIAVDVDVENSGSVAVNLFVFLNTPDAINPAGATCPFGATGGINSCDLGPFVPGQVAEIRFFVEIAVKSPNGPLTAFAVNSDTGLTISQVSAPVLTILGPPEILFDPGPQATNITRRSAVITWHTDDASTSLVRYGLTDSYGQTRSKSKFVTQHSIKLTGLRPDTTYHFQVESTDAEGTVTGFDQVFTTNP